MLWAWLGRDATNDQWLQSDPFKPVFEFLGASEKELPDGDR